MYLPEHNIFFTNLGLDLNRILFTNLKITTDQKIKPRDYTDFHKIFSRVNLVLIVWLNYILW